MRSGLLAGCRRGRPLPPLRRLFAVVSSSGGGSGRAATIFAQVTRPLGQPECPYRFMARQK